MTLRETKITDAGVEQTMPGLTTMYEKDLDVLVNQKQNMRELCDVAVKKAKAILHFTKP